MEWYLKVLKNYAVFQGRARRKEYWMFTLFTVIVSLILSIIDQMIGMQVLATIYSLVVLLPSLGVCVRRLHDIGKSGWWFLIAFIPVVGAIILLVFMCKDSEDDNQYGLNPKKQESYM